MVVGDNGIIAKAQTAKKNTNDSQSEEGNRLKDYEDKIDQYSTLGRTGTIDGIYIIKRWREGKNWYTIYSDGWVEQGGYMSNNSAVQTVNLFVKYADTNYNVQCTSSYPVTYDTLYHPHVDDLTVTSFKEAAYGERGSGTNNSGAAFYWRTEGYGDEKGGIQTFSGMCCLYRR